MSMNQLLTFAYHEHYYLRNAVFHIRHLLELLKCPVHVEYLERFLMKISVYFLSRIDNERLIIGTIAEDCVGGCRFGVIGVVDSN